MILAIFHCFCFAGASAQFAKQTENVQYVPGVNRVTRDTITSGDIYVGNDLFVDFVSVPDSTKCGCHCVTRAFLVVTLHVAGASNRYNFGRSSFDANIAFELSGYNGTIQSVPPSPESELEIISGAGLGKIEASVLIDVTNRVPEACSPPDSVSEKLAVTVTGLDVSGLTSDELDSLVFIVQLIEEHQIHPDENFTLNCSTDTYVKTNIADTTHPVNLSWVVKDDSTACQDLYPSFEVEVLRLYNTSPSNRDSELKTYAKVDWRQAQRFITYGPATHIDFTLAEGTGYYAWRVRPIGNYYPGGIGNEKNWGCWSKAPAQDETVAISSLSDMDNQQDTEFDGSKPYFYYRQFDRDKNWIFNRSFVEDDGGLTGIAEGITYASRLMQPLQVQTPVTTSGDVLVQQSVLDYEGRPLISTLAAPKVRSV